MALTMKLTLDSGLIIEDAYIRIQGINGNKNIAAISLEAFASQELCEQGKSPVAYFNFTFSPVDDEDSPRWDKQAYEYLKTLPKFEGATDV